MSLAENDAWKNSTPNCFTRCAGTVIISRSASVGTFLQPGKLRHSSRSLNPCQHAPFRPSSRLGSPPTPGGPWRGYPQHVGTLGIRENLWIAVDDCVAVRPLPHVGSREVAAPRRPDHPVPVVDE